MRESMTTTLASFDKEYTAWVQELKARYLQQRLKAHSAVMNYCLEFYWSVGKDIVSKQSENRYGSGFYKRLSDDLKSELPDVKGLSPTNLKYMKYYYELFKDETENRPQLVDDLRSIPWGHLRYIIDSCKENPKKALFFVHKTLENNWSRPMLLNFLDTDLYERQGKAISNFSSSLPSVQGELAQAITKDPYSFDFLTLRENYEEAELKDALIQNIEKFLLELGRGFAYMGREFRLEVGSEEKFMDMLFYNTNLHCYVVVEVKITKFKPADLGQLGFYVSAVNHILKKEGDNPTVGLLICKNKDDIVAQYSLEGTAVPIGISEYELSKLYPADFKSSLPSIEEIEQSLKNKAES